MKTANCTFLCRLMILLLVVHFRPSLSCGSNIYDKRRSRKPLMLGQAIPDTTENSQQASGPAKGKITRNSPEFKKLRPNYNNEIIFKDEEGTGADRLMSKRCKDKLNTLANKVKEEWPDLKLVVTEGWDEQDEHSDESLHYEGRAVDLRLSDTRKASNKIGLLGRLAAEAGFDWVYYIKADHIHASVREDGYVEKQWDGCFSSNSTVKLEKGAYLQVRDLKIGQRVQVMMHDGKIGFSEVIMFADYKPNIPEVSYILIETETPKKSITLTASHLIFSSNFSGAELTAKQARMVTPGEFVLVSQHDQLVPARVSRVSMIKLTGMVAPVTMEGNIIVDGVLASCYAMINDHEVAHMAFAPLRLAHNYAFKAWNTDLSVIQQGLHWYPKLLIKINGALGVLELS